MIIERDISQLAVGSYVVSITKQKGDFKIKNSGWVRNYKAIEYLIKQGVLRVEVDTSKKLELDGKPTKKPEVSNQQSSKKEKIEPTMLDEQQEELPEVVSLKEKEPKSSAKTIGRNANFSERLIDAKKTFDAAKHAQSKILLDIKQGRAVDPEPIKELTNQSIETIFENPDALTCILNIRNKDEYLLEHSVSVSILISIFSRYLKLEKTLIQNLAVGAFLHDVGKIFVPDEVLNKPGKLTDAEFELIKTHATHSKRIVDEINGLSEVSREIAANHHEKINGQGYPRGLKHKQLTLYDRMISICDIFDALSAHRVYKKGIAQIRAFAILREMASSGHLDPTLVDQFIRCLGIYPVGSLVRLSSHRLAIVDSRNPDSPTKPKVKAFYNLRQKVFTVAKDIDLSNSVEECIEQGVRADEFDLDMNKITEFLLMEG